MKSSNTYVTVKEFQKQMFLYLKQLPIVLTRRGVPFAKISKVKEKWKVEPGYKLLPERRKLMSEDEKKHIKELKGE